jgi:hypothetical protein
MDAGQCCTPRVITGLLPRGHISTAFVCTKYNVCRRRPPGVPGSYRALSSNPPSQRRAFLTVMDSLVVVTHPRGCWVVAGDVGSRSRSRRPRPPVMDDF